MPHRRERHGKRTKFIARRLEKEHSNHYEGTTKMVIMTEEGKRNVNDDLILCLDRPQSVCEHLVVTLYLLTGERILGVVEHPEPQSEQTSLEVH